MFPVPVPDPITVPSTRSCPSREPAVMLVATPILTLGCHRVVMPCMTPWYATVVNDVQNRPPTTTEVPEHGYIGMLRYGRPRPSPDAESFSNTTSPLRPRLGILFRFSIPIARVSAESP